MRWLKSLVIVLGLLIVAGVLLLGFGFYKKTADPDWRLFGQKTPPVVAETPIIEPPVLAPPAPQEPTRLKAFGNITLNLPLACVITKIEPQRPYLYLEIGPTPNCNRIIVVDLEKGMVLGTIKPQP